MARVLVPALVLALLAPLLPPAAAHGDLAIHEAETLVIRDFEGFEDAFPWGGFEIWDVYVGEGYDEELDAEGVYVKANFAGSGQMRPPGQQAWTVTVRFVVGETTVERQFTHDGSEITHDFDRFLSEVADGNVLQVKGWVALPGAAGQSLRDLVVVSSVDGQPRDSAPGGIHLPAAGAEVPVPLPETPLLPAAGEGRVVEAVPLTGTDRFFAVAIDPLGEGRFRIRVTNTMEEQGQHVHLRPRLLSGWNVTLPAEPSRNLEAGKEAEFEIAVRAEGAAGSVLDALRIDVLSDIGGRKALHAYLAEGEVRLTDDAALAAAGAVGGGILPTPGLPVAALLAGLMVAALRRR